MLTKVRAINNQGNKEEWYMIYVNPEKVSYVEPLTEGDFHGHFLISFDSRDFILHSDDLNAIFD